MKDVRKFYVLRKTVNPRSIRVPNQASKLGDSKITDVNSINNDYVNAFKWNLILVPMNLINYKN
jgi:hypothetical protein